MASHSRWGIKYCVPGIRGVPAIPSAPGIPPEIPTVTALYTTLLHKPSIVFTENGQSTCFARHSCMPHVRRINRNQKIDPIILLKNSKFLALLVIRCRAFWLEIRIKLKLKTRRREKVFEHVQLCQANWGLHLSKRNEIFDVRLEDWSLIPFAERLINVGIYAARRNFTEKVRCSSVQSINKKRCENAVAIFFRCVLLCS